LEKQQKLPPNNQNQADPKSGAFNRIIWCVSLLVSGRRLILERSARRSILRQKSLIGTWEEVTNEYSNHSGSL
jgi:hypothetical protein